MAGTASPQTQPPQIQPLLLQAPAQLPQLLAGDDNDDYDYEGLDTRAAVGEESFQEERAQEERRHQAEDAADSEFEERAFMLKVAAVVRKTPRQKRFAIVPHPRFRPAAVGGGGVALRCVDMHVHQSAKERGRGVVFTLTSLSEQEVGFDGKSRWFVSAQNFNAVTHRYDIMKQIEGATNIPPNGWCLIDELPDTDELSGIPMAEETFGSRWHRNHSLVVKHLLKTRGGLG